MFYRGISGSFNFCVSLREAAWPSEWFRVLDLKSGGPWFKFSSLLLSGFVLGNPKFNSLTTLFK